MYITLLLINTNIYKIIVSFVSLSVTLSDGIDTFLGMNKSIKSRHTILLDRK